MLHRSGDHRAARSSNPRPRSVRRNRCRQMLTEPALCDMWLSGGKEGPPVETLEGIDEPRPVARTTPFAIDRMFQLRRKLIGSIGSIFETRIDFRETTEEGCRFCELPD